MGKKKNTSHLLNFTVISRSTKEVKEFKVIKLKNHIHFFKKRYLIYGNYAVVQIIGKMKYLVKMKSDVGSIPVISNDQEFLKKMVYLNKVNQKIFDEDITLSLVPCSIKTSFPFSDS